MKITTERQTRDLSGTTLFPTLVEGWEQSLGVDGDDYLVAQLQTGQTLSGYRQITSSYDVDTFLMHLDAGDSYQITFNSASGTGSRAMTYFHADTARYGNLIMNEFGAFPTSGAPSAVFTAQSSGNHLLFTQLSGPVGMGHYEITLQKVADVTPWQVMWQAGENGSKAVVTSGDTRIAAGTQIAIYAEFALDGASFEAASFFASGATSGYTTTANGITTVYRTISASQSMYLRDLMAFSFGSVSDDRLGNVKVSEFWVSVEGMGRQIVHIPVSEFVLGHREILGRSGQNDLLMGGVGDDTLKGYSGDDTLMGGAGDDVLNGGLGADRMLGQKGNDTYHVDHLGDVVIEAAGEGTDLVISKLLHYVLPEHVENLTLSGDSRGASGTGNALRNVLRGDAYANTLDGAAGNDLLYGGAGNDTLIGGLGNDTLYGGQGNDHYYLDNAGDVVVETANQGRDTVWASFSYKLGAHVEDLRLSGSGHLTGSGNTSDNWISVTADRATLYGFSGQDTLFGGGGHDLLDGGSGNDLLYGGGGNDTLTGGTGADEMRGGKGDDTYYIDNLGDLIVEAAREGTDRVYSTITYKLPTHVEELVLSGKANLEAHGNSAANVLTGNSGNNLMLGYGGEDLLQGGAGNDTLSGGSGNDTLVGGAGRDILTGGAGADTFVFNAISDTPMGSTKRDTITDFDLAQGDVIDLRGIDASRALVGDQAFSFIGTQAFSGQAGELSYALLSKATLITGDVNGDKIADFAILLDQRHNVTSDYFLL